MRIYTDTTHCTVIDGESALTFMHPDQRAAISIDSQSGLDAAFANWHYIGCETYRGRRFFRLRTRIAHCRYLWRWLKSVGV